MFASKSLCVSCRMGGRIDADSLTCLLCQSECNGHTVRKLSQRHLTANWLAPQESDCSQIHSKVSLSDRLPSYIKATWTVLEIFTMSGYVPDRPQMESPRRRGCYFQLMWPNHLCHCECNGHTVHKLSQRHLTANWLAPQESDCSQMHSKVSLSLIGCQVTSRPHERFSRYSQCLDTFQTGLRWSPLGDVDVISS